MDHAFHTGDDFDEHAEAHQAGDNALINCADFGAVCDGVDNKDRFLRIVEIQRGNEHLTVFVDVNLAVAFCANLLNDFALLADNVADLVGVNLGGEHLGRPLGKLFARLGNDRQHDLI